MKTQLLTVLNCLTFALLIIIAGCRTDSPSDVTVNETGINVIEDTGNDVTGEYFTVDELCRIVEDMTEKEKKDIDDVFTILKKEEILFETKWKHDQKKEVITIIEKAVAKADEAGEYYSVYELCEIVKVMAINEKKDIDDVFMILKKEDRLFETKWKYDRKKEVVLLIERAVAKAEAAGQSFSVKELCTMVKEMATKANKDLDDVFTILKKDDMLFETKWKYEHKEAVIKIIAGAVKKAKDASNI